MVILIDLADCCCHRTLGQLDYQSARRLPTQHAQIVYMGIGQRIVLLIGAVAIGMMALLPPWNYVYDYPGNRIYINRPAYRAERAAGYHPIWQANTPTDPTYLATLFS